jgi:hypothetical protein
MTTRLQFPEIHTHDQVKKIAEEYIKRHAGPAKYSVQTKYDPTSPNGTIFVTVGLNNQAIPYGLPDDRDEIESLLRGVFEQAETWKSSHIRRD